ncbi:archaellin/type IV pilin N-terminal domain-containing protein [Candidatus Nanobsidianus stetteri]|uniref:DUF2341 domain-containing protein n=1 Tax=Nanobsidianus stetteri TaxID=1294122 RepID=A0A2T9WLY2_NANST|nr:archaellin/type IV pilin N-terminal domain-containing protein [Candidatus Nanobsidianus stetteri]MCC5446847.1 hypothetical protein [Candidatus Nanobsidianus stetteri]
MKSISPIIATILLIVMVVAIAGLMYAWLSGMFYSLTSSSSQQIQQQSQMVSFTINNVFCSNNTLYFDIYNNGNVPIYINNSEIIFTDNNGNNTPINGSNIICNNGNIIPIGSNSLCYIINNLCYYNVTNYIESMNFVYNGISYNYGISGNNKFNLLYAPNNSTSNLTSSSSTNTNTSSGYTPLVIYDIPITIYNTQNISTPSPFQQDIAICNGTLNVGSSFAYINDPTLFNQINPNGQNVYFSTLYSSSPDIYSWYEGQLNYNGVTCDVWWINLPNGIPANSSVVVYLYIGNSSSNYYSQYYPYVGASPQVISGYDNGQDVFVAYGYFNNTFDGWSGYIFTGSYSPTATPNGIEMLNSGSSEGTYILPPNNGNIPEIPLIVEEAWYYSGIGHANAIALFGNTSNQIYAASIGSTAGVDTPASNLSTFAQFQYDYGTNPPNSQADMLKSAVTNQYLNYTSFPNTGGTIYSYLIVNSTYAQTGYYKYNGGQVWAPLTLLDTYSINNNGYTYSNLNYNPFQYGTLEISAGDGVYDTSTQYVEWVIARAYPPNGVMPSIYIIAYAVI